MTYIKLYIVKAGSLILKGFLVIEQICNTAYHLFQLN